MTETDIVGRQWHAIFSKFAGTLYPNTYTQDRCRELARYRDMILRSLDAVNGIVVVHNYLQPEFQELVRRAPHCRIGDSLELARFVQQTVTGKFRLPEPPRIFYQTVAFMAQTGKILAGDKARIFISDTVQTLGCSLVNGTDHTWLEDWKKRNPGGILVTYINSDPYTKSISDYISTSSNTAKIILHAIKNNPGKQILVLPDKFLGFVMKAKALEMAKAEGIQVNEDRVEVYEHSFGGNDACCYVHKGIAPDIMSALMAEHWDDWHAGEVDFMIHPECGCASSCMADLRNRKVPNAEQYFLSTSGMLNHALQSKAKKFFVATEIGMIYRLRTEIPHKQFTPVSYQASCKYMKANSFPKLLRSIQTDTIEIVLCDDCCDPKQPYQDHKVSHIQHSVAAKAKTAINRMLSI